MKYRYPKPLVSAIKNILSLPPPPVDVWTVNNPLDDIQNLIEAHKREIEKERKLTYGVEFELMGEYHSVVRESTYKYLLSPNYIFS